MRSGLVVLAVLVLGGCGGDAPDESGAADAGNPTTATVAAGADAVTAVQLSTGTPVARLQFIIESRPEAGKPFVVKLVASATDAVPALQLTAESTDLVLENASALLVLEPAGTTGTHELTVAASKPGLVEIHVKLRGDLAQPEALYSIPVMVGAPAAG